MMPLRYKITKVSKLNLVVTTVINIKLPPDVFIELFVDDDPSERKKNKEANSFIFQVECQSHVHYPIMLWYPRSFSASRRLCS